jgi:molybdopterin-biosynthesis enzyme MoeA-like protein
VQRFCPFFYGAVQACGGLAPYQSDISDRILKMFNEVLFSDKDYLARIEKHYKQFKKKLETMNN